MYRRRRTVEYYTRERRALTKFSVYNLANFSALIHNYAQKEHKSQNV